MNSADRKLLEHAALAAGYSVRTDLSYDNHIVVNDGVFWDPLTDDGDALRLAVALDLLGRETFFYFRNNERYSVPLRDRFAATRRAIVCAAAQLKEKSAI